MRMRTLFSQTMTVTAFLANLFLLGQPAPALAGCGCDKPPPAPAAVIPNVAFTGLSISLFHDSLQVGESWEVVFQNPSQKDAKKPAVKAQVVSKRDVTDPSGETYTPQLVVPVPNIPVGPTRIIASSAKASFVVPEEAFTMIAKPIVVSEQDAEYTMKYETGVGADGTLYISIGGLDKVCKAMEFDGRFKKYPLRFVESDIVIFNAQGFLIEALGKDTLDHATVQPETRKGHDSDKLYYFRHSFEKYCTTHLPGGEDEVDPNDPNWHLDGTPHVDYSTLIFAVAGHFDDNSFPTPGSASFKIELETEAVDDEGALGADEHWEEERVKGSEKPKGKKNK